MASITIRNLDEELKVRLRIRAAQHRRSMEDEVREMLRTALAEDVMPRGDLGERIRSRFSDFGDVVLEIPSREPVREPPTPGT
ncbi:FitA-like ribbon-helix-helix domain-containing protein [Thioalkalivibrio sulfidiphilus]|uniref:FitA-like ribbon-helix-helix domain-containing protein n=1 Tax=Thioalkalivibrio sulfidiphilus TaxID=1033854 RepID=UPI0009DADE96